MTALHLIDGGCRRRGHRGEAELEQRLRGCSALVRGIRQHQSVVFVGPGSRARHAERLGLRIDARISPPMEHTAGAWLPLRRLVDATGRPRLITCWGVEAARLAHRALGNSVPRIAVVPEGEGSPECNRLVVYGASAKQRLIREGAEESTIAIVSPLTDAAAAPSTEGARVRMSLGCGPESILVLGLGPPGRIDAVRFSFVMGLLAVAGISVVGVTGSDAANSLRASRLSAAEPKLRVIQSNRPMPELLAAADLCLFDGGGQGTAASDAPSPWSAPEPILRAHASGVPVVAPAWADEDDLYPESVASHLLAHNSTLPELARKVTALVEDRAAMRACGTAVANDCRERLARGTLASGMAELWDEVMDEATGVEVTA